MAASLQSSFKILADKEWLQTGTAQLNEAMIGEDNLDHLTTKVLEFIARRTESLAGAFYLLDNKNVLVYQNGFALNTSAVKQQIAIGEGLVGQCAASKNEILLTGIDATAIHIHAVAAELKPAAIFIFPVFFEHNLKGVIELASLHTYGEKDLFF